MSTLRKAILRVSGIMIVASLTAASYGQPSGTWTATGSMNTPRYALNAVVLNDGRVLASGGISAPTPVLSTVPSTATAEIYDPATRVWTRTGTMKNARAYHTVTLLPNGRVLVAGGCTNSACSEATATAEIYDPATGSWQNTGNMSTLRYYFAATLLPNGSVLVEGGCSLINCGAVTQQAELFNPSTGKWSLTGRMNVGRDYHTATLLPSGKVLVVGGIGIANSVELYDSVTGHWTLAANTNYPHGMHAATLLPDGAVLVTAGLVGYSPGNQVEIFNPGSNSWTVTGKLNVARGDPSTMWLPTGKALVAGGYSYTRPRYYDVAASELFNPATGVWTLTGSMNSARYQGAFVVLGNGQVLAIGGLSAINVIVASAELYNP